MAAHHCLLNMTLLAIDPFAGDTAMWAFQRLKHGASNPPFGYDFLQLTADGRPTIRDRFLANVLTAGAAPWVVPLTVPAASGLRLLNEMSIGWRGLRNTKPDVIYLDSAHEVEETLIELRLAYSVLTPYDPLRRRLGVGWRAPRRRHLCKGAQTAAAASRRAARRLPARERERRAELHDARWRKAQAAPSVDDADAVPTGRDVDVV